MSLLNLVQRILPVCANFSQVISFIEDKFSFEYGLVNHALAGAMKTLVKVRQPIVQPIKYILLYDSLYVCFSQVPN